MSIIAKKVNPQDIKDIRYIVRKPKSKGGGKYSLKQIELVIKGQRKNDDILVRANQYIEKKEQLKERMSQV